MRETIDTLSVWVDSLSNGALYKGGVPAAIGGGISMIDQVEQAMRMGSLAIGLAIGSLVLYSKIRSIWLGK